MIDTLIQDVSGSPGFAQRPQWEEGSGCNVVLLGDGKRRL